MNKPARARQPPRGSRIDGPPLTPHRQPWQEAEDDLLAPDEQDEGMEEDPGDQDDHILLGPNQGPLKGLPEEDDVEMEDQDPGPPEIRSPPRTRGWAGCQRGEVTLLPE
ncbi:MAG: hypothetical protein GY696_11655 [Gammaproteobacteria bacterium]|nr:hypothetical protein [Gammaproteobacteria bacterium]